MAPFMESRKYIDGVEVKPGARLPYRPRRDLSFTITTYCLDADPERWLGEVRLGALMIARTELMSRHDEAGRAAELMLIDKFADLFGITG